jgi:hypothetical protein
MTKHSAAHGALFVGKERRDKTGECSATTGRASRCRIIFVLYFIDDSDEMTTFVIENVDPPQSTAVESTIGTVRVRDRRTTSG